MNQRSESADVLAVGPASAELTDRRDVQNPEITETPHPDPIPAPVFPAGRPHEWQAADAAGPFSKVVLPDLYLFTEIPIVHWSGGISGVEFSLYHSSTPLPRTFGGNWRCSYSDFLEFDGQDITYHTSDGRKIPFYVAEGGGVNPIYRLRIESVDGQWVVISADQRRKTFDSSGTLQSLTDPEGHTIVLTYSGGMLTGITDAAGRGLVLAYQAGLLTTVTAPSLFQWNDQAEQWIEQTRVFTLKYENGRLVHVTSARVDSAAPAQGAVYEMTIAYAGVNDHRLSAIADYHTVDPTDMEDGNMTAFQYDAQGRVTRVTFPPTDELNPATGGIQTPNVQLARSYIRQESAAGVRVEVDDERENNPHYVYYFDAGGRLRTLVDPLGRSALSASYTGTNRLASLRNVLGSTARLEYDAHDNSTTTRTICCSSPASTASPTTPDGGRRSIIIRPTFRTQSMIHRMDISRSIASFPTGGA